MIATDYEAYGLVGPVSLGDGAISPVRQGKTGELVTHSMHGHYFEGAARGNLFIVDTAVAGIAVGIALDDAPPMALWNPPNSGILTVIQQVWVGYVAGSLGAGTMAHMVNPSQLTAPSGGTELVPRGGLLGVIRGKTRAYVGSTISAAGVILRPSLHLGAALASTATFPAKAYDEVNGSIVIPPGKAWGYMGITDTGATPLVMIGVSYEEVPIA